MWARQSRAFCTGTRPQRAVVGTVPCDACRLLVQAPSRGHHAGAAGRQSCSPMPPAGVVGAVGNNKIGVTGLNQRAQIITCRFMDATGNGWVSDAVQCIDYCISKDAHIMSNSWGGVAPSDALTVGRQ